MIHHPLGAELPPLACENVHFFALNSLDSYRDAGNLEIRTVATAEVPYEVSLEQTHSTVIIRPPLTEATWADIEEAGDDIVKKINGHQPKALLIDLTPIEHMGSSMVAMIVRLWKSLDGAKQRFVVVTNSEVVRQVLELSGLSKMWTIAPTREAGLKTMGIRPTSGSSANSGSWILILGVVAVLTAVAGLAVWVVQPAERELATGLIYGGAIGGFVIGLIVMVIAQSTRRFVGLGLVLLSAGAGLFRLMQH